MLLAGGGLVSADVVVFFATARAVVGRVAVPLARLLPGHSALWLAWPRRAAGHASDITDEVLRRLFLPLGLVDTKVAALGTDWSGLKFVWRRELRAKLGR